eukprot:5961340-Amphidinium_carterae.1
MPSSLLFVISAFSFPTLLEVVFILERAVMLVLHMRLTVRFDSVHHRLGSNGINHFMSLGKQQIAQRTCQYGGCDCSLNPEVSLVPTGALVEN